MWSGHSCCPLPLTLLLIFLCVILSEVSVRDQRTKTQSKDPYPPSPQMPIQGVLPRCLESRVGTPPAPP